MLAADVDAVHQPRQRMMNTCTSFAAAQPRQHFPLLTPVLYVFTDLVTLAMTPTRDMLMIRVCRATPHAAYPRTHGTHTTTTLDAVHGDVLQRMTLGGE
jgi:hypothetical protein